MGALGVADVEALDAQGRRGPVEVLLEVGQRPAWAVESFRDVDQDVRQSMQRVRTSPFLLSTSDVRGFVFDVRTGALREVDPA